MKYLVITFTSLLLTLGMFSCKKEQIDRRNDSNQGNPLLDGVNTNTGGNTCTEDVFFDNTDPYDYVLVLPDGATDFFVGSNSSTNQTITASGCIELSVYDGSYYEGTVTVCPCTSSYVAIDFY